MLETFFGIVFVAIIILAANIHQSGKRNSHKLVNTLLIVLASLSILFGVYVLGISVFAGMLRTTPADALTSDQIELLNILPNLSPIATAAVFSISVGIGFSSIIVVISESARRWIGQVLIRQNKLFRRYNPKSLVHTVAIVLALIEIVNVIGGFALAGGIEGLATRLEEIELSIGFLLSGFLINVVVAWLGVGIFIRRNIPQTLRRLGLLSISPARLVIGAVVGFFMFWIATGTLWGWSMLISPEQFAEQSAASEQLFLAFSGSLFAGFMLAGTAAIGEEMLFRGALQPIFGMVWTSIFFALLHTQYTLTPAALVIFSVSMMFGWLRWRFDTATAITAHFVYNFVPFVLLALVQQIPTESLLP